MARKSVTTSRNKNTLARRSARSKTASTAAPSAAERRQRNRPERQKVCWIPKDVRRVATVTRADARDPKKRKVPCLVFCGDWLREAGFPPGAPILVRVVVRGQLVVDRFL
jgi:hypothetical protein